MHTTSCRCSVVKKARTEIKAMRWHSHLDKASLEKQAIHRVHLKVEEAFLTLMPAMQTSISAQTCFIHSIGSKSRIAGVSNAAGTIATASYKVTRRMKNTCIVLIGAAITYQVRKMECTYVCGIDHCSVALTQHPEPVRRVDGRCVDGLRAAGVHVGHLH